MEPDRIRICLCNDVAEADVRRVVAEGAHTLNAVYRALGCPPQCGRCGPEISRILATVRYSEGTGNPVTRD